MTTETASAEETTQTTELPDNLVAIPSGELHERAEALAAEAETLFAADDWVSYKAAAEDERKLRAEIERRGDAARKDVPVETAIPISAQEKLEQTRQALADAEKALEDFAGVKARGNEPLRWVRRSRRPTPPSRQRQQRS